MGNINRQQGKKGGRERDSTREKSFNFEVGADFLSLAESLKMTDAGIKST